MALKKFCFLVLMLFSISLLHAQTSSDSLAIKQNRAGDDPSSFFTRVELFNELQYHDGEDLYLNQTTWRTIVKIGKRFTTRIDIPLVYNSFMTSAGYQQFGLGDISFRVLGYSIFELKKAALTASVEISLNTADSRLLGTGKNLFIPVVTYSKLIPKQKMLIAVILQQANSFSGDETRPDISFTKVQPIILKFWSKRLWSVAAPSIYIDYIDGGGSMVMEARMVYAPAPRINVWAHGGIGVFGDFKARYQWSAQLGSRYFLLRKMNLN